jgi:hypothetical protein
LPLILPNSAASSKVIAPCLFTTIVVTNSYFRHYSVASRSTQQPASTSTDQRLLQVRVAVSSRTSAAQSGIARPCHPKHLLTAATHNFAITIPPPLIQLYNTTPCISPDLYNSFLGSRKLASVSRISQFRIFIFFSGASIRRKRS